MGAGDIATVIVYLFFGFMTGQALADTWKPQWQILLYGALLSVACRVTALVLFSRHITQPVNDFIEFLVLAVVISGFTWLAFRLTRARKMVTQYPWLYERHGLFGWRAKPGVMEK